MERIYEEFKLQPPRSSMADGRCEVSVWNRKYTVGDAPFLSSVTSAGVELLSAPMRLVGEENGEKLTVTDTEVYCIRDRDEDAVCVCQSISSKFFLFNTAIRVEEDGCIFASLTVATRGKKVSEIFGLGEESLKTRKLTRLWLEIPLKPEAAEFYHFAPQRNFLINGNPSGDDNSLCQAGRIPSLSLSFPFINQLYVSNDKAGFAVFFETDKDWQYENGNRAIECVRENGEVIIRIRLLDSEPRLWTLAGEDAGLNYKPISFEIGMQATPVKPFPKNPYKERNLHIDCFKKIPENYEDYLFACDDTGEMMFDRIKRLGVNTLYIHEKWNDIQNSPVLTEKSAQRLKLIVEEAHKRNIRVIPYFGYEMSTLHPLYAKKSEEYLYGNYTWSWYRVPEQRAVKVCYNSGWQDYFVEGLERLIDEFKFDGFYFDSIMGIGACNNESHGCGYRDGDGRLHSTYPVSAVRRFMKRVYDIAEKRGCIVENHGCAGFPISSMAYTHNLWEGETVQSLFLKGQLETVPEDFFRSVYTGRSIGVPVYMLCYSNPPVWTFEEAMSNTLCFGIIPKPNDAGAPLALMNKLWSVLDSFPIEEAEWHPYFDNGVQVSNKNVNFSFYKADKKLLCFVSNMKKEPFEINATLPFKAARITDALSGEVVSLECESFSMKLDSFGSRILRVEL